MQIGIANHGDPTLRLKRGKKRNFNYDRVWRFWQVPPSNLIAPPLPTIFENSSTGSRKPEEKLQDFFRELTVHDEDFEWTKVDRSNVRHKSTLKSRLDRLTESLELAAKIDDPKLTSILNVRSPKLSEKEANRELFRKHRDGRKNTKE